MSGRSCRNRWSPFFDYSNKTYLEFLDGGKELLWMSERSGWNHLYLIDTVHGAVKNPVTRGEWVVRGVDKLDAEQRRIWVRVSGIWPNQDPYHMHLARVNLDGTGFVVLTEGDGTHEIQWSPDRRFFDPDAALPGARGHLCGAAGPLRAEDLGSGARPAAARRTRLRRRADRRHGHQLAAQGVPRRLLAQPEGQRLAGPHRLAARGRRAHGRGSTSTRVGIFGGSAGGQSALAACCTTATSTRSACRDCGCHDNRMDKIWWNEAWMGWPIGPWYADNSNVTHAGKLQGKLLLTVGELDQNVDPASTYQVVAALIKAGKPFEFLPFPGAGHGAIESDYGRRLRADFFVRSLKP
jgi:hypothetical protein